jgi:hypothetical protein
MVWYGLVFTDDTQTTHRWSGEQGFIRKQEAGNRKTRKSR